MGLAAAQSRFLLLTARQNSVSSEIMSLTNQQMALERQSAILSSNFNRQKNAQSVTFNENPLNYSDIYTPNSNGYNMMLTTSSGAVLLSNSLSSRLQLGAAEGSGADFQKKFGSQNEFISKFVPGYTGDSIAKIDPQLGNSSTSAYKYDATIMNNAIVSVSPATTLGLGGYLASQQQQGQQGQEAPTPTFEFAMGLQQNSKKDGAGVAALACIATLDKYAYTEANVHNVVNNFVTSACTAMSDVMLSELGNTDAVNNALAYATRKTQEEYANKNIVGHEKNIQELVNSAEDGTSNELSDSQIHVSQKDLSNVKTLSYGLDSDKNTTYETETTLYDGKEVCINTAQLTATFLTYFDAGMIKEMGGTINEAYTQAIERSIAGANDAIGVRDNLEKNGVSIFTGGEETEYLLPASAPTTTEGGAQFGGVIAETVVVQPGQSVTVYAYKNDELPASGKFGASGNLNPAGTCGYTYGTEVVDGNTACVITNSTGVPQTISYYVNGSLKTETGYQRPNTPAVSVIGGYGNETLLSDDAKTAATGIYGAIGQSGSTASTFGVSASGANNTYEVSYYKSLYNALATGGWKSDNKINDPSYLSQQMLYGNVVLNRFNNTASWSALQLSDPTTGLATVDDKAAQEKAQSEYDSASAILETKKTFLENQAETLQTESEAIETEKESIKSIIETEQEKLSVFVSA